MRPLIPTANGVIGIFAPSSPFDEARFEAGCDILRGLGFTLEIHPQTYERQGYLAGSDEARRDAFWALAEAPHVAAIIAARGGYGAHRWIQQLDPDRLSRLSTTLIGFSDVCAVHSVLQKAGLESVHGPVVTQLPDLAAPDHQHLADLLRAPQDGFELAADGPVISEGQCEGPLVGGCLAVLTPLIGSPYLHVPQGAVLLLEDVGEAPYRIDRALTHLHLCGLLDRVAGIALGDFVNCRPPRAREPEVQDVLQERLGSLGVPVLSGLPIGHGTTNRAVPLGRTASLDTKRRTLTVHPSTYRDTRGTAVPR